MTGGGGPAASVPRWRAVGTALAALFLVAAVATAVRQGGDALRSGGGGELRVDTAAGADGTGDATPVSGAWELLPPADLAPRADPLVVSAGDQVLVWGGRTDDGRGPGLADGALYRPVSRDWFPVPAAPRPWRDGAVGVWTGHEVIVLGARPHSGQEPLAQVLDPVAGSWRELPRAPHGLWAWHTATWTGELMLVLEDPHGHPGNTAVIGYDPDLDEWRRLGSVPAAVSDWRNHAMLRTGQVVLTGPAPPDRRLIPQAFRPGSAEWRRGRSAPVRGNWLADMTADPAADRVLLAGPVPGGSPAFAVAAWSPDGGWEALPEVPPSLRARRPVRVFATDAGPLLWPSSTDAPPSMLTGDRWRALPEAPIPKRTGEGVAWTPDGLFVWGGRDGDSPFGGGALFRPVGAAPLAPDAEGAGLDAPEDVPGLPGTWASRPSLPEPIWEPTLVTYDGDPAVWARWRDGSWRLWTQRRAQWEIAVRLPGDPATQPCLVDLADQLLFWQRTPSSAEAGWTGFRVRPGADGAESLPPPPLPPDDAPLCTTWRGEVVIVVATANGSAVAAFDPATTRWRALPVPPVVGVPLELLGTGAHPATEDELLLLTDLELARLDRDGRWHVTDTPRNSFPTAGAAVTFTGADLLVLGGTVPDALRSGWAWNAERERWRQLPLPWFGDAGSRPPHTWNGVHWIVWGPAGPGTAQRPGAVHDPVTGDWLSLPAPPDGVTPAAGAWLGGRLVVVDGDGRVAVFRPRG